MIGSIAQVEEKRECKGERIDDDGAVCSWEGVNSIKCCHVAPIFPLSWEANLLRLSGI